MTYVTGSITGSANPTGDLLAVVEAQLTAHPSWTFVEEHPTSYNARVWRNDANDAGVTFYVYLSATMHATYFYGTTSEGYDEVAHEWVRWVHYPGSTVSAATINPDDTLAATATPSPNVLNDTNDHPLSVVTNTTDFAYSVWVTRNLLLVGTDSDAYPMVLGVYDSLLTHPNEFPLIAFPVGHTSMDHSAGRSRVAGAYDYYTAQGSTDSLADLTAVFGTITPFSTLSGSVPSGVANLNGQARGAKLQVTTGAYRATAVGSLLGTMPDVLVFDLDVGVQPGDTIEVDGKTYAIPYSSSVHKFFLDTTAA